MRESRRMKNIVLIGMPACGKSVAGVLLAKSLKMNFLDTDLMIQERSGKSLQDIIDQDGMDIFKKTEESVLLSINTENTVIATGGSAVYYHDAMDHLGSNGIIVYIDASLETIVQRLDNIRTRGVAIKKGQTLAELYSARAPLYERFAEITVKSENDLETTVANIITALKKLDIKDPEKNL